MKTTLITFLLLFSLTGFAQTKAEQKILLLLETQTKAWNNGDLDGFMKGYWKNDSLQFIGKSGVTYGWTNTLNNYKKGYPNTDAMGQLHFDILSIKKLSCKYQRVVGKWSLKRKIGDVGGHFTLLLKKIKGEWVIIADHSS